MYNYKAHIKYDGQNYFGYSVQKNQLTIQGSIEKVLLKIFKAKIKISASGRTDRYVHALDQVISFKAEKFIALKEIKHAMNGYLPKDIQVNKIMFVKDDFNARFSVKRKTYKYLISQNYDLFKRNYQLYFPYSIDFLLLKSVSKKFIGKHNFLSFTTSCKKNTIREIYDIKVFKKNKLIIIEITASGFLRYMVRMITGKLISIAKGSEDNIIELLQNPKKGKSIYKVEPHGLYLKKVEY